MTAVKDGEVTKNHTMTILKRYGLVADARFFRFRFFSCAATQSFSPNETRTKDSEIMNVLCHDQAVVPMAMSVILIVVPLVRLGGIVLSTGAGTSSENRRALVKVKRNVAFEMDRVTKISACRKVKRAAAGRGYGLDPFIYRRGIDGTSIAVRAEAANVIQGTAAESRD